jgi:hypothetical protein
MVQPIEHPLQCDERSVAVRALVDVALQAAPGAGRQIAIDEIGEMFAGPAVIETESRAAKGVDHHRLEVECDIRPHFAGDGSV